MTERTMYVIQRADGQFYWKHQRMVNPEFNDICETVEAFERKEE